MEAPLIDIGCVVCKGEDPECSACNGTGRVGVHRCPWTIISPSDVTAVELSVLFIERGLMPEPGTILDQTAQFYDVWRIVAGVKQECFERSLERDGR